MLAIIAGAIPLCGLAWMFQVVGCSSVSMSPTLLPGDSVLVNRLVYSLHPPQRGDLIVFHFPQTGGREFLKRVIGLPGDVVEEEGGRFSVNGTAVRRVREAVRGATRETQLQLGPSLVPANRLYVLGDNDSTSLDSRFWGTVDEHAVVGKAILICWSRGSHWWDVRWDRLGYWLE